jgi:O-antigen ligase
MKTIVNNYLFLKVSNFCICLLPLALLTGPAFPDFLVILSSIFFLVYLFYSKFDLITEKKLFFFFLLFYFFLLFSSSLSFYPWISLKFSLPYIRFILLAFLIAYLLENNKLIFLRFFFITCLVAILILFFDSIFQFYSGKNTLGVATHVQGRIGSIFGDELILGSYALKISPMFFISIFYLKISDILKKKIFFIAYSMIFFIILISGDRAPLLLFFIYSLFLFFLFKPYRKLFFVIGLLLVTFFIMFLTFNKPSYNRIIVQTINEIGFGESNYTQKALGINKDNSSKFNLKLYSQDKKNFFSAIHENYFIVGIKIFNDHPIIGAGPKAYSQLSKFPQYALDDFSYVGHPHNFYIQLLAETGIIGFTTVFLFLIYLIIKYQTIQKNYKQNNNRFDILIAGIAVSGLLFHLWPLTTTGSFFTNYNCILIYMCLGFFLGEKNFCYTRKEEN